MEPMDVDGGPSSQRLDLIKAVRSLDDDAASTLPEKVHRLWLLLSASKSSRLHGVEESILRWLLKQMVGNTPEAEQVRRYPLTWMILSHVFPKIPAQTLGRSLSYLRFTAIVHKTSNDISKIQEQPALGEQSNGVDADQQSAGTSKKRKRSSVIPSNIDELRLPEACIQTATEVFNALDSLLGQVSLLGEATAPEKRVGAEHIKTLFSSAHQETRDIVARLLSLCDHSLNFVDGAIPKGRESWIEIIITLWNFRLHSTEDSLDFAVHLFAPVSSVIGRLKCAATDAPGADRNPARELWIRQLEQFMSTYFVRPARQQFNVNKSVGLLESALGKVEGKMVNAITVLWDVAARTPRDSNDPKSRIAHASWATSVFAILLKALHLTDPRTRNATILKLLETSIEAGSIPDTDTLRDVCKRFALFPDEGSDWKLVAKILACDAEVFLMDHALVDQLFEKVSLASTDDTRYKDQIVDDIIIPLQGAFVKARDLRGFVNRWYECLTGASNIETEGSLSQSIWFDAKIRQQFASTLQSAVSSAQLLRMLQILDGPNTDRGAVLTILDGVCAGLTEEDYIAKADPIIFSQVFSSGDYDHLPSTIRQLRWRIATRMAFWETAEECRRLWHAIKPSIKPILKSVNLSDHETFEAFTCCHSLCLASHIGGKREAELVKLLGSFLKRLAAEIKTSDDPLSLRAYLEFTFHRFPRLAEQPKAEENKFTELIMALFQSLQGRLATKNVADLCDALRPLLQNFDVEDEESVTEALISGPLDALIGTEKQCGWTQKDSLSNLLILHWLPREALTKTRRKRLMVSWKKWQSSVFQHATENPEYSRAVLRLMVKMMQQPTFYDGMGFDDIKHIASYVDHPSGGDDILRLVERLVDLTYRQIMASSNTDELSLSYLQDTQDYLNTLSEPRTQVRLSDLLIAKGLISAAAAHSSTKLSSTAIDLEKTVRILQNMIVDKLTSISSAENLGTVGLDGLALSILSVALNAASCVWDAQPKAHMEIPKKVIARLDSGSATMISSGLELGWKLRTFLMRNGLYDLASFRSSLQEEVSIRQEDLVSDFAAAFLQEKGSAEGKQLLPHLLSDDHLISGSIGPLLAIRKVIENNQAPYDSVPIDQPEGSDLAYVHGALASLLTQAKSLRHFKLLADVLALLLDKHAGSMTQFNIEKTLSCVVEVCSRRGPDIQDAKAPGEVYESLYRLVALVIKRHRLRLRGHFPILILALQALLRTLAADPHSPPTNRNTPHTYPHWLTSRLGSRHAERFARLLTLICEPSAASVARGARSGELDSATDAAKRAAGQDMFLILEAYIKLQLEAPVPLDIRRPLELGVYSVLDVTSAGARRVLNESLDANGRVLFRQMFADYRKFGKWSGV
ncbi:Urb2/Npa2 family-domain-containing protein [Xylariomycetidae sp. FL2044]|nr:Urb2/Npa2 family-domain-containing protein [Xylariomycetidae sp. FL2044]